MTDHPGPDEATAQRAENVRLAERTNLKLAEFALWNLPTEPLSLDDVRALTRPVLHELERLRAEDKQLRREAAAQIYRLGQETDAECTCTPLPDAEGPCAWCDIHGLPSVAFQQGVAEGEHSGRVVFEMELQGLRTERDDARKLGDVSLRQFEKTVDMVEALRAEVATLRENAVAGGEALRGMANGERCESCDHVIGAHDIYGCEYEIHEYDVRPNGVRQCGCERRPTPRRGTFPSQPSTAVPERPSTAARLIGPMTRRIGELGIALRRLVEVVDDDGLPEVVRKRLDHAREVLADNSIIADAVSPELIKKEADRG